MTVSLGRQSGSRNELLVPRRNIRCEQLFSTVLPTSDIRRERASEHAEDVPLHPDNTGMRPDRRDRTSRLRHRRLKLTIGTQGELLSDRGRQNSLALADCDTHDQRLSNRTARR
jgi:hypothetical protein